MSPELDAGFGVTAGDQVLISTEDDFAVTASRDAITVGQNSNLGLTDNTNVSSSDGNGISIRSGLLQIEQSVVEAERGAGIYVAGGSAGDLSINITRSRTPLEDRNIVGNTGSLVENGADGDGPNLGRQFTRLEQANLEGLGDVAVDLGAGDDVVDFGLGFFSLTEGDVFDGGDAFDAIAFSDVDFAGAIANTDADRIFDFDGDVLEISSDSNSLSLSSFETFRFADGDFAIEDFIAALGTTPVPSPDPPPPRCNGATVQRCRVHKRRKHIQDDVWAQQMQGGHAALCRQLDPEPCFPILGLISRRDAWRCINRPIIGAWITFGAT